MATDYGPFSVVVTVAGSLMAAGGALALSWRGRAKWADEEDIAKGSQKVGALVTVLGVGVLWALYHDLQAAKDAPLLEITMFSAGLTVAGLLAYGMLVGAMTYDVLKPKPRKIIGGFVLTAYAKKALADVESTGKPATAQDILAANDYDPDKVWKRGYRAAAKQVFVVAYMMLSVSGTLGLASVSFLTGASMRTPVDPPKKWLVWSFSEAQGLEAANAQLERLKSQGFPAQLITAPRKGFFVEWGPYDDEQLAVEKKRFEEIYHTNGESVTDNPTEPW